MFDRDGAENLPGWLQDAFFMMVVSNSCMNPIVYGSYVINCSQFHCECIPCFGRSTNNGHLNNGEMQMAAGQSRQIARRVIKCVLGLKKVGSGATRSTAMGNAITRSPVDKEPTKSAIKRGASSMDRPSAVGHISFFSERSSGHSYRASFHSEPLTNPYPFLEQQTLGIMSPSCTTSEPSMSPKCNIKININEAEVYYNRDFRERTKIRNI